MDALSKDKKDQYATAFAILALYDGGAEVTSEQIGALLEATGNTEVEAFYPIIFANFLNDPEKIGQMIASPGAGGGGTCHIYILLLLLSRRECFLYFVVCVT
jgi:large subunit ribosomal protein LP1